MRGSKRQATKRQGLETSNWGQAKNTPALARVKLETEKNYQVTAGDTRKPLAVATQGTQRTTRIRHSRERIYLIKDTWESVVAKKAEAERLQLIDRDGLKPTGLPRN